MYPKLPVMDNIVFTFTAEAGATTVGVSNVISRPFRVIDLHHYCSVAVASSVYFTPYISNDQNTGVSPVTGNVLFSPSSPTTLILTGASWHSLHIHSPIIDAGHFVKVAALNPLTGNKEITVIFHIEYFDGK